MRFKLNRAVVGLVAFVALSPSGAVRADDFLSCSPDKARPQKSFLERAFTSDSAHTSRAGGAWERVAKEVFHQLAGDDVSAYFGFIPKLNIINSRIPNAFAMKSGTILASSGLLNLVETQSEFAFILAHELGHVILKHDSGANALMGNSDNAASEFAHEVAADSYAVDLLHAAGFEPGAALDLLKRLQHQGRERGYSMANSYPSLAARITALDQRAVSCMPRDF